MCKACRRVIRRVLRHVQSLQKGFDAVCLLQIPEAALKKLMKAEQQERSLQCEIPAKSGAASRGHESTLRFTGKRAATLACTAHQTAHHSALLTGCCGMMKVHWQMWRCERRGAVRGQVRRCTCACRGRSVSASHQQQRRSCERRGRCGAPPPPPPRPAPTFPARIYWKSPYECGRLARTPAQKLRCRPVVALLLPNTQGSGQLGPYWCFRTQGELTSTLGQTAIVASVIS